jgi:O-antigen/teichoic acid export membrane protein
LVNKILEYIKLLNLEFIIIAAARIVSALLQLLYLKLYTQSLSNNSLGNFALWCSISYVLNAAIFVPLDYYQQSKIYPFKSSGKSLLSFVFLNLKIFSTIGICTFIFYIIIYKFENKYFFICSIFFAIGLYLTTAIKNLLNNLEFKITASLMQPIEVLSRIIIFYALIYYIEASSINLMLSQVISFFIVIAALVVLCKKYRIFSFGIYFPVNIKEILIFCYPISIGSILNLVQLQGYRMVLVPLGYGDIVGIYFGITQVGIAIMGLFSLIYFSIYSPMIYKTQGDYIWKFIKHGSILISSIFFLALIFSSWIIPALTKVEFESNSSLIVYGVIAEGGNLLIAGLSIYLTIINRPTGVLVATSCAALASLVVICALHGFNLINVYTIGLPIVMSQIIAFVLLYKYAINYKKLHT